MAMPLPVPVPVPVPKLDIEEAERLPERLLPQPHGFADSGAAMTMLAVSHGDDLRQRTKRRNGAFEDLQALSATPPPLAPHDTLATWGAEQGTARRSPI
jgi:hypothetical protein